MPAPMYISDSFKGMERKENKDRVWCKQNDNGLLAVLFDGISSAEDANKGIDIATEKLELLFEELTSSKSSLSDLMYQVNEALANSEFETPFTTYNACYIPKDGKPVVLSNMGDSRTYEVTPQYLKQLSEDDNLVHNKNVVTKYLGMVNLSREEVTEVTMELGTARILLCSDGFYSVLEENLARFFEILNFKNIANTKKSLETELVEKNQDDASYILIALS